MNWFKITISLVLLVIVGVGSWAIIDKLDDDTFRLIVGVLLTLLVVLIVGALFIGYGLVQAYVSRRLLAQDDMNDMKQMAMIFRMMGGRGNTTVKIPDNLGQARNLFMLPGSQGREQPIEYRDTMADIEIQ